MPSLTNATLSMLRMGWYWGLELAAPPPLLLDFDFTISFSSRKHISEGFFKMCTLLVRKKSVSQQCLPSRHGEEVGSMAARPRRLLLTHRHAGCSTAHYREHVYGI